MTRRQILVVEDERLVARDIAFHLQELGYDAVGIASTGEQAIEMAERLRPQLVLMDIHLASAMDGVTAAQAIRKQFGISVVFLSAFSDGANMERALLAEPRGFLAKPFMDYELRDVLATALA